MSLGNGSKIVRDALVFAFDMSSKQSWKGKPTTNLVNQPTTAFSNWSGFTGTSTLRTTREGRNRVHLIGTASGGVQWYNTGGQKVVTPSTEYTVSATIKYDGTTPHPNLFYVRQYNSSGSQTSESGKFSTSYMTPLGDGWYRAYRTFTTDSTAVRALVQGYQYSSPCNIQIQDVQLEIGNINSPYVDGARSNNEAIIDWAGKNIISPVDLEYSSDGSFKFNGLGERDGSPLGSYLPLPSAVTTTLPSSKPDGVTYDIWLNVDTDAPNRLGLLVGSGTINHIELYSTSKYFRTEAVTQNGYSFGSGGFPDNCRGVWSNFIIVFANNEPNRPVRWYQNGKLFYTHSNMGSGNDVNQYFLPTRLGSATGHPTYLYADSFKGQISSFKVYNKALSESEVNTNFQALRGRHDL